MKPALSEISIRDGSLIMAIRTGDEKAYVQLKKCYAGAIYFMILRMVNIKTVAKDLTDESFEKAFLNLHQYHLQYPFSAWLFSIAHNHAVDHLRRKKITDSFQIDLAGDIRNPVNDFKKILDRSSLDNPEELLIRKDNAALIRKLVSNLEPQYRIVLEMHYFEQYSYSEMASKLKMPIGAIKVKLFRSRKLLYRILNKSEIGSC